MSSRTVTESPRVPALDAAAVRRDFPILARRVHGKPLVYFDNAATTQKPRAVIDRLVRFYSEENANVHRGVHALSERATDAYERARVTAQRFIHAGNPREIVFVRGTTEAINLVAQAWGRANLSSGDEVILSVMEHHSNIVPWQMVCEAVGARLRVVPMTDGGELCMDQYERLLSERTKLVSMVHVSNALGTINPIDEIVGLARQRGAKVLVDGAQAVAHMRVDVQALDCDFYAFSGHKVLGPTGIGVLYAKGSLLDEMPPYQGGGDMISSVTFEKTRYNIPPHRFEAGTPNIAGAVGLAAALEYLSALDLDAVAAHEHDLLLYGTDALSQVRGLRLTGTASAKSAIFAFVMEGVHPHDVGTILDRQGVAIRTGHHCCQPLMDRLGVPATARASLALYNTREEFDVFVEALDQVRKVFA
jgi:cysteine desulfurase/selenocysteine lyase